MGSATIGRWECGARAVLGFGKLGSGEMTYASTWTSYVSDTGGTCVGSGRDAGQLWHRVAMDLGKLFADPRLYPIDVRLRPWGDQGPLVTTLANHA